MLPFFIEVTQNLLFVSSSTQTSKMKVEPHVVCFKLHTESEVKKVPGLYRTERKSRPWFSDMCTVWQQTDLRCRSQADNYSVVMMDDLVSPPGGFSCEV